MFIKEIIIKYKPTKIDDIMEICEKNCPGEAYLP
jgi:hypothetical protein